jgi:hypothetical protein
VVLNNTNKIMVLVALICVMIGITISRMLNTHSEPQTKQKAIIKHNVDSVIKDTISVKGEFTNANVSIIAVDGAEYLIVKYGSKFEIVKHKDIK